MELLDISDVNNLILENGKKEDDVICSMVYKFAKNLPYSMDYCDDNFILGDFINYIPSNSDKYLFKEYGSVYNKMINWSDTLVSGIQLQVCNMFQKMLLCYTPNKYNLSEEDYYTYGFDKLTSMEYYNKSIFNLLRRLPYCSVLVNSSDNAQDRRNKLEEVYIHICDVTNYVIKKSKDEVISKDVIILGKVVEYNHRWKPAQDLEMMFYFERIENYNLDCSALIDYIKEKVSINREGTKLVKKLDEKK